MFRSIVIAASAVSFAVAAVPAPASAQTAYSGISSAGCNTATGRTASGAPCKGLIPLSNDRINAGERIANVPALNRSELAEVFECRDLDQLQGTGAQVVAVVEDCGTPAPPATLTNFKPYAGELVAATPAPPPPPPAAPYIAPTPPPAALPPAPPVYAAVPAAAGLGGSITPLLLGAAGLAAVVGIAVAIDDDDDDATGSTTGTTGTGATP